MATHTVSTTILNTVRQRAQSLSDPGQVYPLLLDILRQADIDYRAVSIEGWKQLVLQARRAMRSSPAAPPMNGKFYQQALSYNW